MPVRRNELLVRFRATGQLQRIRVAPGRDPLALARELRPRPRPVLERRREPDRDRRGSSGRNGPAEHDCDDAERDRAAVGHRPPLRPG